MNSAKTILVVEGDAAISGSLCQTLARAGFSVSIVRCLRDAREQLSLSTGYSVIICENHLPDGTGLELLDDLRRGQDLRVPVLLISGNWTRPLPKHSRLAFLTKPFDAAELLAALQELVRTPRTDVGTVTQQSPTL